MYGLNLEPVPPRMLVVGEPAPFPIYDKFGKLLLSAGGTIRSQRQLNTLCQLGFYPPPEEPKDKRDRFAPEAYGADTNPFAEFDSLGEELSHLYTRLVEGSESGTGDIENRFFRVAGRIQGLVKLNTDALLGTIHMEQEYSYPVRHALHVATVSELVGERIGMEQKRRLELLAAALTANIAMHPYQEKLHSCKKPLTEEQWAVVARHPEQSVALLHQCGVTNKRWLTAVRQHHERLDGSGYPNGLSGRQICLEARILAIADVYTAMVNPRAYRPGYEPRYGLKEILEHRGLRFDEKLSKVVINQLRLYPPGAAVELVNGEIAVIIGRTREHKAPRVASVRQADGQPFMQPRRRNTMDPNYAIKRVCRTDEIPPVSPSIVWGIKLKRATA